MLGYTKKIKYESVYQTFQIQENMNGTAHNKYTVSFLTKTGYRLLQKEEELLIPRQSSTTQINCLLI